MQTVKVFHEQGLRFPRRIRQGVDKGDLHWVKGKRLTNPGQRSAFAGD
jgi:hypothetical protein